MQLLIQCKCVVYNKSLVVDNVNIVFYCILAIVSAMYASCYLSCQSFLHAVPIFNVPMPAVHLFIYIYCGKNTAIYCASIIIYATIA